MSDLGLPDRILAKLARATNKRPERADDLLAKVGGEEREFWVTLERLIVDRAVNTAHIQRAGDAEPWLALWPTGVHKPAAGWNNNAHSCLFTPSEPMRDTAHKTDSTRVWAEPKPAPVRPFEALPACPEKSPVQRAILRATRGLPQSQAVPVPKLAERIGVKDTSIQQSLLTLERAGKIGICKVTTPDGAGRMRSIRAVYDPSAPAAALDHIPDARKMVKPTPQPTPQPTQEPTPMLTKHSEATGRAYNRPLQARILAAIAGLTRDQAITCVELSRRTGATVENLACSIRRMLAENAVGHVPVLNERGQRVRGLYDISTNTGEAADILHQPAPAAERAPEPAPDPAPLAFVIEPDPAPIEFTLEPEPEPAAPPKPCTRFALWDDGALVVEASDRLLMIEPEAVERLARLLGVPRNTAETTA